MPEYEAYALVLEQLAQAHALGESIWGRIDLWIGLSSGIVVLAYFAPDRLTKSLTFLILTLYFLATIVIGLNILTDNALLDAIFRDAILLATSNGIVVEALEERLAADSINTLTTIAMAAFFLGLLMGASGYVLQMCRRNYESSDGDDDT